MLKTAKTAKTAKTDYLKQVKSKINKSSFGGFFLSNSARNKKFDGARPKRFNFSEIQSIFKGRSAQEIMEHEAAPVVLICFVFVVIGVLYIIMAALSSAFLLGYDEMTTPAPQKYDNQLIIEIEEVLSKLMELRKNGNMKEYEAFLQPTMKKYCLEHISANYLDIKALESFHMNLAETISFVSRGNEFTEHKSLAVNYLGGIIDPIQTKETNTKSCPLLTALYELGHGQSNGKKKPSEAKDKSDAKSNSDSGDKFDQRYSWQNMQEFMEMMSRTIRSSDGCRRIGTELNEANMRHFVLNFYEIAEIIGLETAKEEAEGNTDLGDFKADPNAPDYKKWVIGRDGGVYQTDRYDESDAEFLYCEKIEDILNDKFVLDDNLSYTNVKIAIDEKFKDWYQNLKQSLK